MIFHDDADRLEYVRLLRIACIKYYIHIWAYCLMPNHVHLILVPLFDSRSLSDAIGFAHGEYAKYFNAKYELVGHLWQSRFRSSVMDPAYTLNAIRYVERNPVKAGMVRRAEDYRWSSAAAHCGLVGDRLLRGECPYTKHIENWSEWLAGGPDLESVERSIKESTRKCKPLGSMEFLERLEAQTGHRILPRKRGPKPKASTHSTHN